jgi:hypothetical protein
VGNPVPVVGRADQASGCVRLKARNRILRRFGCRDGQRGCLGVSQVQGKRQRKHTVDGLIRACSRQVLSNASDRGSYRWLKDSRMDQQHADLRARHQYEVALAGAGNNLPSGLEFQRPSVALETAARTH